MKNTRKHSGKKSFGKRLCARIIALFMVVALLPVLGNETVEASFSIDNLSIDGETYNILLPKGYSANLMGTISSSYTITQVNAKITGRFGVTIYDKTIKTSSKSVNLRETALNKSVNGSKDYIKFGSLDSGTYTLTIKAWSPGYLPIYKSIDFTISGSSTPVTIKKLSIEGMTSNITLPKGKSANLNGIVFAGRKITSLSLVVRNQYGITVYNQTINPSATYVNVKDCALNKAVNGQKIYLKFGSLASGNYTLTLSAKTVYYDTTSVSLSFTISK